MGSVDLREFEKLLKDHRDKLDAAFGPLHTKVASPSFDMHDYRCFAANYAARTMLTLPSVLANCLDAALDLNDTRTTYGAHTANEEAGDGKPDNVHATLMMDALNTHGEVCYGMAPIELRELMLSIRLLHVAAQLIEAEQVLGGLPQQGLDRLRNVGLVNIEAKRCQCLYLAKLCNAPGAEKCDVGLCSLEGYADHARRRLGSNILKETLLYCSFQLRALCDPRPGYIQGVGYALEGLADTSMYHIFQLLHAAMDKYSDQNLWHLLVYPYFRAHGFYWERKLGKVFGQGVEKEHAKREIEKLGVLDEYSLPYALEGAEAAANYSQAVWEGIKREIVG